MKSLVIGRPYITNIGRVFRLQSEILSDSFKKTYYFEVEENYGKYLCFERSDAFVVGLLYFSMVHGFNIICEAPLSERLYYQLTNTYIPNMSRQDPELFKEITITAQLDSKPIMNIGGVGASVSGGVDSFYTILRNYNKKTKEYNITHLLLTDCFNIYHEEAETRKRFEDMCVSAKKISDELGLDFISIYTNENIFWYPHFVDLYCMRYCSLPYALQKLFAVYNYSTSYQYKDFTFKAENRDASHYDFFTVHLISNENITFYSSGGEASRADKAEYIANNKVVQKYLQVCNLHHTVNCCVCDKCIRTQLDLYACKKIQKFDAVFDLNEFEKNKNRSLQNVIVRGSDFDKEILLKLRKNNISISSKIIIKATVIKFLKKLIKMFKPIYCFLWEIKNRDNPFDESDKYNKDYCYAKECNPEIVSLHR